MDLAQRLREGRRLRQQDYRELDKLKLGNLRAGNSGILTTTGEFAGCCPHMAHLRQLGVDLEQVGNDKLIMFQMGIVSEDAVYQDLIRTASEGEVVLREEQIPIEWRTSNGTKVTGRPDMVICRRRGEAPIPELGIELKSVASVYTTAEVLFEAQPKLTHLIQAAHYSWKLGVPYKLSYKQYVNQQIPSWLLNKLAPLDPGLQDAVEMSGSRIKQVVPYEIVYEIEIDSKGQVLFRLEGIEKQYRRSIVNVGDIERFYEFVSRIEETGDLGSSLTTIDVMGRAKSYDHCKMYCPAHKLLGKYAHDYSVWREELSKIQGGPDNG